LPRALDDLAQAGVAVFGLDAVADRELAEVDLRVATCLVVGSEGKGLRRATKKACTESVRLPMPGPLASLNASVAAGIALYEVVRQRRAQ
ncbi:MAG: 23S rRNA (guanosine(2251)-2'-O)-methyltransferase RlmB, partial [Flavobacteriales bacterium]|nr:23S rRNA (guanosine(2251)-2'-O)-methyltransferase RlmB [Flavobacteriales bacterium]